MKIRLVQPFRGDIKPRNFDPYVAACNIPAAARPTQVDLSHLVWRFDPEQCQPRRKHGGNPLNKHKPGFGQLSIILDNEA
jgi:hypothetical protein